MHRKPTSPRHPKGIYTKIRTELFAADSRCYYCRCQTQLPVSGERHSNSATIDHKTPISRGGHKASRSNLALCCLACNHAKADQTEAEFRATFA
jgi:5-methylcytosine-specific restriction endonuclease McrA